LLLTWILTGLLTVSAALSYGELAACFLTPAGNTFICAKPIRRCGDFCRLDALSGNSDRHDRRRGGGFCALSRRIASRHFAKDLGCAPIALGSKYAISLSVQQLVGIVMVCS
jgi:hypothetical protein